MVGGRYAGGIMIEWETYCDEGYFHLYAVRPVGDMDFGSQKLFHVQTYEEAQTLCHLLNTYSKDQEHLRRLLLKCQSR